MSVVVTGFLDNYLYLKTIKIKSSVNELKVETQKWQIVN